MKSALLSAIVLAAAITASAIAQQADSKPASSPASAASQVGNTATHPASREIGYHRQIAQAAKTHRYDVIFLGDSITSRFDKELWETNFAPLKAGNFGIGGDRTENLLWRITTGRELEYQHPRLFVLMIGVNNLWGGMNSGPQVSEAIELIINTLREKHPQTKILLLGILPTDAHPKEPIRQTIRDINAAISHLADGSTIRFLDFGDKMTQPDGAISREIMPDLLHPNAKGYEIYVANVKPVITEMLAGK